MVHSPAAIDLAGAMRIDPMSTYVMNLGPITAPRASARASHATGASRRSGERGGVQGSPRGEAPRSRLATRSQPMKRMMTMTMGMALTTVTLAAQAGGGVAPHVAVLK